MRNTSWKDWFGAEVGFSIYIHRRGFTSSSTNSNQPSLLPLPRRVSAATGAPARLGSSHQHAGQAPPYRGHKAKFAPCETPPGRVGLVLKLDSLYIYIGGVSHHHAPSIINQCYLPPKARERANRCAGAHPTHTLRAHPARAPRALTRDFTRATTLRARPNARDPTRGTLRARANAREPRARPTRALSLVFPRAQRVRTNTLGKPIMPVSFTPLLRGLSPRLRVAAACAGRSGLL